MSTATSPINKFEFHLPVSKWTKDFKTRIRSHEPGVNRKLYDIISKAPANSVVVDAGAHVGDTGLLMASTLKQLGITGRIVEIDPDPSKLDFIVETAHLNGLSDYIVTVHAGLGDRIGTGKLDKRAHAGAWHIMDGSDFDIRPLDDIMRDHPTPYLIKLDVEGYETFAVRGGRKVIAHAPFLMIEVVGHQLRKKGSSVFELHDEIQSLGKQCAWKSIRDQLYTDDATNENTFDVTAAWGDADMKKWTLFVISVFIIYTATWRFKRKSSETKGYSTIR